MDEILFRGKYTTQSPWATPEEKAEGSWFFGYYVLDSMGRANILINEPVVGTFLVDAETVGQYTGKRDKNGTRIFAGDWWLPPGQNVPMIVGWGDFGWELKGLEGSDSFPFGNTNVEKGEVVGNIHDTPQWGGDD